MAEYIEREAYLAELAKGTIITDDSYGMGIMAGIDFAMKKASGQPAADVAPVVHGKWINRTKSVKGLWDYRFDCSACDHIFWSAAIESFNYCPNCGARMIEEDE